MIRAVGLLALLCCACSSSSDPTCGTGGDVTASVSDAANNDAPICDASVTMTPAGGAPQPLTPHGPPSACTYNGKFPQGSYVVTVTKATYRTQTINLRIGSTDGCHVDSVTPALSLDRTP